MTRKLRLRPGLAGVSWLIVATATALGTGCSATSGSRFRAAEGSRSVASIGDRTLPPSVGSPGSQVATDTPTPEPYRNPKTRIAGRVVDGRGRPVSGASVRLADGPSKAGRDVRTVTDASGAFTLGGLRPGSGYSLVAEADFGDRAGVVTGRTRADTSESGVQIRLGSMDTESAPRSRGTTQARSISDQVDVDPAETSSTGVNEEDLGPPAEAADAVGMRDREDSRSTKARESRRDARDSAALPGWRRPGTGATSPTERPAGEPVPSFPDPRDDDPDEPLDLNFDHDPGVGRVGHDQAKGGSDDDANPLPPALPAKPKARTGDESAASGPTPSLRRLPRAQVVPVDPAEPRAGELTLTNPSTPTQAATSTLPAMPAMTDFDDLPTMASGDVPRSLDLDQEISQDPAAPQPSGQDSNSPTVASADPAPAAPGGLGSNANPAGEPIDSSANYNPFALVGASPPEPMVIPPGPTIPSAPSLTQSFAPDSEPAKADELEVANAADPAPPKIKKWGDLTPTPFTSTANGRPVAATSNGSSTITTAATTGSNRPSMLLTRRTRSSAAPSRADAEVLSQFDTRANQLINFQLPDLDGQSVRFSDFDADYVLLDFWGTWCKPCVDSIPHLIQLQNEYGPNKLKIVGIACEKTTPDRRKATAAATAEKLGINYSVLVTNMDGDCPVQRDFQVRFHPTMVLLDRRGKVLFRAEGATESNLFRLDRKLAELQKPTQTARR